MSEGCGCTSCEAKAANGGNARAATGGCASGACGIRPPPRNSPAVQKLWFEQTSPFATSMDSARTARGMYEWSQPQRAVGALPLNRFDVGFDRPRKGALPQKRGRLTGDDRGDVWAQEAYDASSRPTGTLPGGLTAAEWSAMSEADRTAYVSRLSDTERTNLVSSSIREGITGMTAFVRGIYDTEIARMRNDSDRAAARERAAEALQLAQVNAERDVRLAEINAGRPITSTNALSDGTTTATPMSTTTKVIIGAAIGVPVVGLLAYGLWRVLR